MISVRKLFKYIREYGVYVFVSDGLKYILTRLSNFIERICSLLYWRIKRHIKIEVDKNFLIFDAVHSGVRDELNMFSQPAESILLEDFVKEIKKTDTVVDVGANIGVYTCFASSVASRGKVVAFEPYPPNCDIIRRNLKLNNQSAEIIDKALSNKSSKMSLSVPVDKTEGWGKATLQQPSDQFPIETKTVQVNTEALDTLVDGDFLRAPDVVKIDVEGAEFEVIQGMTDLLADNAIRCIYIEVHRPVEWRPSIADYAGTEDRLREVVRSYGYEITEVHERNAVVHLKATRK